jgi:dihydroflavonol-4-reductase
VAKALAAEGAELRLLVRKTSNLANLEGIPGDTHVGDLPTPTPQRPALAGCDAVVHVAADYRLWIPDPAAMYRANVDGTRELLRWPARPASSASSTPPAWPPCTSAPTASSSTKTRRSRSPTWSATTSAPSFWPSRKAIAAAQDGQQVIILNPTTPIGPNDAKPTPTGRIFVDFLNGKFPAYMDTGLNLVDVPRSPAPTCRALTKGQPGRRYILGGENLTLKQILDKMSAITGIPSPTVKIPFAVAATYAFFEEWITGRIRGREPRATLEEVRMGRKKMYASSAHAQQELGFRILPVYPAMRAAIEWFRANGYAPQA